MGDAALLPPHLRVMATAARSLDQAGAGLVGHANAAITLGVYSRLVPEDLPASPFGDDLGTIAPEADRDDKDVDGPDAADLPAVFS